MKCRDCEFCFPDKEKGYVCADAHYGDSVVETLDEDKNCYSESLEAFIERQKESEILYPPNTKLNDIKIDLRKTLYLNDKFNNTIEVNAKLAKELFGEIILLNSQDENFELDTIFPKEIMNGRRFIIIKK